MGREQRRKEIKKEKKNHITNDKIIAENVFKFSTFVKIIIGIAIILLVLYYLLAVFVTKEVDISGNKDSSTSSSNSSDTTDSIENKIIAASSFMQAESAYYVYYYDFSDEFKEVSNSISNISDSKIYRVDTKSGLNSKYVTEGNGNRSVTGIDNLKVINPTLIKIENDSVIEYYEGVNEILNYINR